MGENKMVFDAAKSMRSFDDNGYLHVALTPISKASVNPYYGYEISDWEKLGLDPRTIYYGLRDPAELKKAAATFNGLPLLLDHHSISAEHPAKEHVVGSTGTDAVFDGKYLKNSLSVTDAEAIRCIENGSAKEISCAYRFRPDFTPGVFETGGGNIRYDFIMRDISGNHVALVAEGRAGHDVAVADGLPKVIRKENVNVRTRKITRKITRKAFAADKKTARDSIDSLIAEFAPQLDEIRRAAFKAALAAVQGTVIPPVEIVTTPEPGEIIEEEIVEEAVPVEAAGEPEELTGDPAPDNHEEVVNVEAETETVPEVQAVEAAEEPSVPEDTMEATPQEESAAPDENMKPAEDDADGLGTDLKDPKFKAGFYVGFMARRAYDEFLKAKETTVMEDEGTKDTVLTEDTVERLKTQASENARRRCREITEAAAKVKPIIGNVVDPLAYDSAADIYRMALERVGKRVDGYDAATCKAMVEMLADSSAAMPATRTEKFVGNDCFRYLKNIAR